VHIILLSHQGYIPPAIATIIRVDPTTVCRAIHRFKRHGLRGLLNAPRSGRPSKVTPAWEELLVHTVYRDDTRMDALREGARLLAEALMEEEIREQTGAGCYERTPERSGSPEASLADLSRRRSDRQLRSQTPACVLVRLGGRWHEG
jgi:hypothetical protein